MLRKSCSHRGGHVVCLETFFQVQMLRFQLEFLYYPTSVKLISSLYYGFPFWTVEGPALSSTKTDWWTKVYRVLVSMQVTVDASRGCCCIIVLMQRKEKIVSWLSAMTKWTQQIHHCSLRVKMAYLVIEIELGAFKSVLMTSYCFPGILSEHWSLCYSNFLQAAISLLYWLLFYYCV